MTFLKGEMLVAYTHETHKKNVDELKKICKEHKVSLDDVFDKNRRSEQTNKQLMNEF